LILVVIFWIIAPIEKMLMTGRDYIEQVILFLKCISLEAGRQKSPRVLACS